jgi:hypothetical protein
MDLIAAKFELTSEHTLQIFQCAKPATVILVLTELAMKHCSWAAWWRRASSAYVGCPALSEVIFTFSDFAEMLPST